MQKTLLAALLLAAACASPRLFVATDLTPENSFTENCEGPNVDAAGNLYVVNFQRDGTVGIVRPGARNAEIFIELPAGSTANAIRFDSRGEMLLADFTGHNILKINPLTKKISVHCHDARFNQPNDLCVSRADEVYASDPNWADGTGQLWKIAADGTAILLEKNMGTTNGIELSPDGRTLYVNESIQRKIWAYDVTAAGVANKRLLLKFPDFGLDGMKCDERGNLYVARWGKGTVAVVSPVGKLLREVPMRGKKVSNVAFGGKDGRTVFVTVQDRKCVETFRRD